MKKFLTYVSLALILFACVFGAVSMAGMQRTYEGQRAPVSVYELQQDPASYDDSQADGASIVFDFRGYDTMGEAFILITAVAGAVVILYNKKKEGKSDE